MRILKIHFKNLNSLAGEWEVDFTQPVFQEEGCFLITGPTGSGKSTLLDAVSLALYGRTPRLEGFSAGKDEIMTRNTNECFADVYFQTAAGTFCAHWSHRRARRGQNPFAKSEQSLIPLEGTTLRQLATVGSITKKGEKDKEIEECTGLNYAQFTRAILLAQGEFDQFLKAKREDKALILEKLTSSEIYRELSKYAHRKSREAEDKLEEKERELGKLNPLSIEEVTALRQQIIHNEERLGQIKALLRVCRENMAWVDQVSELKQEAKILDVRSKDLRKRQENFAPLANKLEEALKATCLDSAWAELELLRKRRAAASGQENRLREKLDAANAELAASQKKLHESMEAYAKAQDDARASRPLLGEVRILDRDIMRLSSEVKDLCKKRDDRRQAWAQLLARFNQQEAREKQLRDESARLLQWQSDHEVYQYLVTDMASLKIRLDQLMERRTLLSQAQEKVKGARRDMAKQDEQLATLARQLATAEGLIRSSRCMTQEFQQRRKELLGDNTLSGLKELREEKERSLRGAVVIKSLEEHRARLADGEPCPLCGAVIHPFATPGAVPQPDQLEKELEDLKQRLAMLEILDSKERKCQGEQQKTEVQLQVLRERSDILKSVRDQAASQLEDAAKNVTVQQEALDRFSMALDECLRPLGMDVRQKPEIILAALEKRLSQWQENEKRREKLEAENRQLIQGKASLLASRDMAGEGLVQVEAEVSVVEKELARLRQERQEKFGVQQVENVEKGLEVKIRAADAALETQRKAEDVARGKVDQLTGNLNQVSADLQELAPGLQKSEEQFAGLLASLHWDEAFYRLCCQDVPHVAQWQRQRQALNDEEQRLQASIGENAAKLEQKASQELTTKSREQLTLEQQELERESDKLNSNCGEISQHLKQDEELRTRRMGVQREVEERRKEFERWKVLNDLIGSSKGNVFSSFAQSLTLDTLLAHANIQFSQLLDRYRFSRAKGEDSTGLVVIDSYHADERRPLQNLSGGETFLASLALALGLSAMASRNTPIDSLFLDEGFGSLDEGTLYNAVEAIKNLRGENKLIGIISHVEALKEHIPLQIEVRPTSSGRSALYGPGCRRLS